MVRARILLQVSMKHSLNPHSILCSTIGSVFDVFLMDVCAQLSRPVLLLLNQVCVYPLFGGAGVVCPLQPSLHLLYLVLRILLLISYSFFMLLYKVFFRIIYFIF